MNQPSVADELLKFANLRSMGALTDAEFEAEKAKLLMKPLSVVNPNKRGRTLLDFGVSAEKRQRVELIKCPGCAKEFQTTQARGGHVVSCKAAKALKTNGGIEKFLQTSIPNKSSEEDTYSFEPIVRQRIPRPSSNNQKQSRRTFTIQEKVLRSSKYVS